MLKTAQCIEVLCLFVQSASGTFTFSSQCNVWTEAFESSRQPSAPTTWSNLLPHQFQKCKDLCWWQQVTTNSYIWFLKLCLLIDRYLLLTWWIFFLFWFSTQIEKHCTMIYVIVSLQAVIYISILFSCIVYNVLSTE